MATPSEPRGEAIRRAGVWLARGLLAAAACSSVAWGATTLPDFVDQTRLDGARDVILRNVPISDAELDALGPALARAAARSDCMPAIDRSTAVIRLRLAENALASGDRVDARMGELDAAIHKSLGCAPADPYLWLVLFWLRNIRQGLTDANFDLLRMSYRLGPNEGWIVVKRSAMALAMFDALPPDLSGAVVAEFARLVKTELYTEAIDLLKGPGWAHREKLLAGLATVPKRNVDILTRTMADIGYDLDRRSPAERRSLEREPNFGRDELARMPSGAVARP
ncbi:hypothetical protein [Bradyrhizobium septentrionale]|uniref:Uncharacterized protein n=1 Tax=Bradyrhizobium septentrionale TaxID=1404411 RepID=A0A973VYY7_9BRAD|nr:hypothetical protein [Bradyrhizobium septentrionale]UGY21727.1 hypothetical protein HU675_0027335 [Bradyrhizobium septentrionale]